MDKLYLLSVMGAILTILSSGWNNELQAAPEADKPKESVAGSANLVDLGDLERKLEAFKKQQVEFVGQLKESDKRIAQMIHLAHRCRHTESESKLKKEKSSFAEMREKIIKTLDTSESLIVVDSRNVCTGGFEKTFEMRKALYEAIKKDIVSSGVSKKLSIMEQELLEESGAAKARFDRGRSVPTFVANQYAPSPECQMRHEKEIMKIFDDTHKWIIASKKSYIGVHAKIDEVNNAHSKLIAYGLEKKASCEQSSLVKTPPPAPNLGNTVAAKPKEVEPPVINENTKAPAVVDTSSSRAPVKPVSVDKNGAGSAAGILADNATKVALNAKKARDELNQPSELIEPGGELVRADPKGDPVAEKVKILEGKQNASGLEVAKDRATALNKRRSTRELAAKDDWKKKVFHDDGSGN